MSLLSASLVKLFLKVEPIEVLLRLEGSSKWPDELDAIRSTGTAFLLRLAQCLEKQVRVGILPSVLKGIGRLWLVLETAA